MYKLIFICVVLNLMYTEAGVTNIEINTDEIIQKIPEKFLSVTIDTDQIQDKFTSLNLRSPKVQSLAKALTPCYLRVGGSSADFLEFSPTSVNDDKYIQKNYNSRNVRLTNFTMTGNPNSRFVNKLAERDSKLWDELNEFREIAGMDMIFCLNSLRRRDGLWLPDNAKVLLDYTTKRGYKIAGWELGNEPDVYRSLGKHINGSTHAEDYMVLHHFLKQYPQWKNAEIIGPSVTMLNNMYTYNYLLDFLKTGGPGIVTNPTFHHYYDHGPNLNVKRMMDPKLLDNLIPQINAAKSNDPHPPYGKFWLSETSSAWGGGALHLSDRYIAGFMWLDKLGLSAAMGIDVVVRQDFYGSNYGLIDIKTFDPNPDIWLSYLFNKLVGQSVLNVTIEDKSGYVRMYAHCTTSRSNYTAGSITVYGMNLKDEPTTVKFSQFASDVKLHTYLLQPVGKDGLQSKSVALNGRTLMLNPDYTLPNMYTPNVVLGSFTFPEHSFGFIVIPDANDAICQTKK